MGNRCSPVAVCAGSNVEDGTMTDLRQAAQQALDALETLVPANGPSVYNSARDALRAALAAPQPFDLNEALSKERFSTVNQAIRHGMLAAIDEIDAEIECSEMEYEHDPHLKQLIVNALERAKNLVRDRMAHGIGGDK